MAWDDDSGMSAVSSGFADNMSNYGVSFDSSGNAYSGVEAYNLETYGNPAGEVLTLPEEVAYDYAGDYSYNALGSEEAIESDLDKYFGGIEADEALYSSGAFADDRGLFGSLISTFSSDAETKPTWDEYSAEKASLIDKYGDQLSGLSDEQVSALAYAATIKDNQIQSSLSGGFAGSLISPLDAAVGTIAGIINTIMDNDEHFAAAQEAVGLSDEDMAGITQAWDGIKSESLANFEGFDSEGSDNPYTTFDSETQTILAGQVVDSSEILEGAIGPESSTIPGNIPDEFIPGLQQYVDDSNTVTSDYNTTAAQIWNDYLEFESTYFDKFENIINNYQDNLDSVPALNMKLPDTLGGATIPMAPKVHSAMYTDQANTMGNLTTSQANSELASLASRDALNNNMFNVGQTNLSNVLLPTTTGLDLYKMERAGEMGLDQIYATADANEPSTLEKWAPVVGTMFSPLDGGGTVLESAWDFVSGLW